MEDRYLKAIAETNRRLLAVEQKLDAYFLSLHNENSEAIDEIVVTLLAEGSGTNEEQA